MYFLFFISCLFIFLLWYCFVFEPYNFKIEKVKISLRNLPSSFENIKIVQISDIHSKKFGRKERIVLDFLDKLKPDYVFITGDIIDYKARKIEPCRPFWHALGQRYVDRIFAVFGNHIHQNKKVNVHIFKRTLEEDKISVLVNENRKLQRAGEFIYIVGVDDPSWTKHQDFEKARQGVESSFIKVLLAHSPEIIEDIKPGDVDLILCGHTHGGQVKLPYLRAYWDMTKYHGRYARGLFKVKEANLYVNRGVGTSLLPIRFNCPPEITLIELRKK